MTAIAKSPTDLTSLTIDDLRAELAKQMQLTAQHLIRLAAVVAELERRGEDLSDLRIGMLHHLRRIAAGQVLPEIVVRFANAPGLLAKIGAMPIPDQQRLIDGESIKLLVNSPDGGVGHLMVDPMKLTRQQVTQIFARDHIRDEQEQRLVLAAQRNKNSQRPKTAVHGKIRTNRKDKTVSVGRYQIDVPNLLAALAELAEDYGDDEGEDTKPVAIQLTESQHRRLRMKAAESGRIMGDMVRDALRAYGLI